MEKGTILRHRHITEGKVYDGMYEIVNVPKVRRAKNGVNLEEITLTLAYRGFERVC